MNWDQVQGNWKILKGKVREQWGKITDDEFDAIAGQREQLNGAIQKAYGIGKDKADEQISIWINRGERERWLEDGGNNASRFN